MYTKEQMRKYMKLRRENFKAEGRCIQCGKKDFWIKKGYTLCQECSFKQLKRQRKYKERKLEKSV